MNPARFVTTPRKDTPMISDYQLNRALDITASITRAWPGQGHAWAVDRLLSALADVPEADHHLLLLDMVLGACRQHAATVQTAAKLSGYDAAQILALAGHGPYGSTLPPEPPAES